MFVVNLNLSTKVCTRNSIIEFDTVQFYLLGKTTVLDNNIDLCIGSSIEDKLVAIY